MAQCELCGRTAPLSPALVEGAKFNVCEHCINLGVALRPAAKPSAPAQRRPLTQAEQVYEFIVPNAGALIKAEREKLGLKQIDLSRKLFIRESLIHQIESGKVKPTLDIVKKFEEAFGLKLIARKSLSSQEEGTSHTDTKSFTLGDFVKKK